MSASSVTFTLVLLGTILAGHADHPVLWLLVGPAPLCAGFTAIMAFRKRTRPKSLVNDPSRMG
jgi:hypothetical protein